MTDVKVSIGTFRRLIRKEEHTGAIFEAKNYCMTSVGNLMVWAKKATTQRIFPSYPYLSAGYVSINSSDVKPLTDKEIVDSLIEEFVHYKPEELTRIREAIDEILADNK